MEVNEKNFEKVEEIIGYLAEFMIKIHATTSASYINLKDRISTAQVGLDALESYYDDLQAACRDPDSEEKVIGF